MNIIVKTRLELFKLLNDKSGDITVVLTDEVENTRTFLQDIFSFIFRVKCAI